MGGRVEVVEVDVLLVEVEVDEVSGVVVATSLLEVVETAGTEVDKLPESPGLHAATTRASAMRVLDITSS